jgi:ribosome biogenesis GTPase
MTRQEKQLRKFYEERAKRELMKANKNKPKARAGTPKPPREKMDVRQLDEDEFAPHKRLAKTKESPANETRLLEGLAVEIGVGYCDVESAGDRIRCRSVEDNAIGDRVLFSPERQRIQEVLPRRTALSRPDPHNPRLERVIAANVDVVVNVVSVKTPPLSPGLIDRYLVAIAKSGAEPLVCVNKIDLVEDAADLMPLLPYELGGIKVVRCSANTGEGIEELRTLLRGKLCVFAGHSGVGKSSLLNALAPDLGLATGSVSTGNTKGRHTTTSSGLYRLANGMTVIDTPGIREFGLWNINASDLRLYYNEFTRCSCGFSDCSHTHEPECGVKAAVESGEIHRSRYEGYLRILASLDA